MADSLNSVSLCERGDSNPYPVSPGPDPKIRAAEIRFWTMVQKTDWCWLWTGRVNEHGYGRLLTGPGRTQQYAHRYAWTLTNGAIPAGLCVCHTCDNPKCVNPLHLFLGTQRENMHDMIRKGRLRNLRAERQRIATHCMHGHEFTDANTGWRPDGSRRCKICGVERSRRRTQKRTTPHGSAPIRAGHVIAGVIP